MAKKLKSGLVADRVGRSVNVCAVLANTGTMCQAFRHDQVLMRRSLRRRLTQSTEAVATFVASLRADCAKGRADFAKAHRHMARAQRTALTKDRRDRSRDVAELIASFHVARGVMAQELAENLAKSTQEIKYHVSGLNEWCRISLQKSREFVSFSGQVPNYLLAAQGGGAAQVPSSALHHEVGERKNEGRVKTKTTVAKPAKRK